MDATRTDAEWMVEVGRRLRALREARSLTVVEAAERSGLSRSTVTRAEQGDNPTLLTVVRLLRVYGRVNALAAFAPPPLPSPLDAIDGGG
ncbi:MAG: helix-turn-helix transcriptional regulator [Longimicrobiales bacterium]